MFRRRPAEPLERATVPWLLASAVATTAPHVEHQPHWLMASAGAMLLLGCWLWFSRRGLPPRWLLSLIVVGGSTAIWFEYRTLFGRDAGVALLILFMALKPLEMRSRRDAMVVVMLGLFLLLTHYFYSQSIPTGLWLIASCTLLTATLIRIFGGAQAPVVIVRHAAILLLQATPFMLILFLLFPRINGPLWGLPQDAHSSRSGLPETIEPGTVSNLVLDGSIAFRARFDETPPATPLLYWRGPVMDEFDGRAWRATRAGNLPLHTPRVEARGTPLTYEITLESHQQRWLLALDAPLTLPSGAVLTARLQAFSREPVRQRSRFAFTATTDYRFGRDDPPAMINAMRQLPRQGNPQARALAEGWRQKHASPTAIVAEALQYFRRENFVYTLQPPLLGNAPIDQFLFETRSGFCEHYASAFVFLMRAAGIPARVVAGYQGGEVNPVDGFVVVRQSDAHAWAEVWSAESGWQRVDPTAAIAPSRVETGIATALPAGEPLPALARIDLDWLRQFRYRWEAINNRWNQWVLGYNPDRQRELLRDLGLGEIDWRGMTALLATLSGVLLLAITIWALWRRPPQDAALRLWLAFCARLARSGLPRHSWEGPQDYAARVARERPALADAVRAAADAYVAARYAAPQPRALEQLAATLKLATRQLH